MPAYDLRIFKSWNARNLKAAWVNNYVFNYDQTDLTSSDIPELINAVTAMEKAYHLEPVQFLHATFSTVLDEPTYDPTRLRVIELQGTGGRGVPAEDNPIDLNITLKLKKEVAYGRSGTMFFRGALLASDVVINSRGEADLSPAAAPLNPVAISNAYGFINNFTAMQWIMKTRGMDKPENNDPIETRAVKGLRPSGVVVNKRDHRYFDELTPQIKRAVRWAIQNRGSVNFGDLIPPDPNNPALPEGGTG